jgi:small subunit ribosomal protein S20
MPQTKAYVKDMRQNKKRRTANRMVKAELKTLIKKARTAQGETAAPAFKKMQKALDKAVQTGLMHRNTAARYKSQSAKKIPNAVVA